MPTRRSDTMRAVDAVMPLVDEFNLLDEGDKLTFLDLVDPLPEKHDHRPKKKASKKSSKSQQSSSKSPRASGIQAQLKERRQEQREPMTTKDDDYDGGDGELCTRMVGGEIGLEPCEQLADHNIHHLKLHPGYHEFQSGKSTAPPAPASSPANGELSVPESNTRKTAPLSRLENSDKRDQNASLSPANSGTPLDDAGTVAHGASGGRVQG